jgi:hypothetical protein
MKPILLLFSFLLLPLFSFAQAESIGPVDTSYTITDPVNGNIFTTHFKRELAKGRYKGYAFWLETTRQEVYTKDHFLLYERDEQRKRHGSLSGYFSERVKVIEPSGAYKLMTRDSKKAPLVKEFNKEGKLVKTTGQAFSKKYDWRAEQFKGE